MLARHLQFSQGHIPNTLWHLIFYLILFYTLIKISFTYKTSKTEFTPMKEVVLNASP